VIVKIDMTFRRNTFALTALLGLMTALGPLSTDMYLPSLPAIGASFGATDVSGPIVSIPVLLDLPAGKSSMDPCLIDVGVSPFCLADF